jgi:hypothetical protein
MDRGRARSPSRPRPGPRHFVALSLAVLPLGCAGDGPPATGTSQYERIQNQIFNVHCLGAGCHNTQSQAGGLVLVQASSFGELVNVVPENPAAQAAGLLRVAPFEPERSFILIKLTEPGLGQGDRMPLGAPPLSPADIGLIRDWIAAGASPPPGGSPAPSSTPTPPATATPSDTATVPATETPTASSPTPTASAPATTTASLSPTLAPPTATPTASPTITASPTPEATVSLAQIQDTIFTPVCATMFCHSSATRSGNLVLEEGQSFGALVNVLSDNPAARNAGLLRVRPGDPDTSFLVIKLEGPTPAQGSRMPLLLPPLDAEELELIRRWIAQGAPAE